MNETETENFNKDLAKMKNGMTLYEKILYGIILNGGVNKMDLDVLLTLTFMSGQSDGIKISQEAIKGMHENKIDVG